MDAQMAPHLFFFLAMFAVAYPIGIGLAAVGSALGIGRAIGSAAEATARQPEAFVRILVIAIVGSAFIEALTIYALISPSVATALFSLAKKATGLE